MYFTTALILLLLTVLVTGRSAEYDLQQDLLNRNISRVVLPRANRSDSLTIQLQSNIYSLVEVDERAGFMKIMHYLYISWVDINLKWNPDEYDGIDSTRISVQNIWIPDITVLNQMEEADSALPRDGKFALVFSDGMVMIWYLEKVQFRCHNFDLSLFPFDTQRCSLLLTSLTYAYPEVNLVAAQIVSSAGLRKTRPNTDFDIVSYKPGDREIELFESMRNRTGRDGTVTTVNFTRNATYINYNIAITRKSAYYITSVCVPTVVIITINFVGLFGPFDIEGNSEERITLGLTTLLAMSVLQGLVASEVPRGGGGSPLLGNFLIFQLILCAVATAVAALIMALHQQFELANYEPPKFLSRLANTCLFIREDHKEKEKENDKEHYLDMKFTNALKKIEAKIDRVLDRKKERWLHIFRLLNLICFVLFNIINITVSVKMLTERPPPAT